MSSHRSDSLRSITGDFYFRSVNIWAIALANEARAEVKMTALRLVNVARWLLLLSELEVLGTLDGKHLLSLALLALHTKYDLLGGLCLLVEDWLGLTTETLLLGVVTTLTLSVVGSLASLVLGDLVDGVLSALRVLAEGSALLWYVHHLCCRKSEIGGEQVQYPVPPVFNAFWW